MRKREAKRKKREREREREREEKKEIMTTQKNPFHLVDASPWPMVTSTGALMSTTGGVMYMHKYNGGGMMLTIGQVILIGAMMFWFRDVIREGTFEGQHTSMVQLGLRIGMIMFIVSEVMFFVAFFWAFFWSAVSPVVELGGVWPPQGIEVLNAWEVPLLNTMILLASGAAVTWAHHGLIVGNRTETVKGMILTVSLALIFTGIQVLEYRSAGFSIGDGIYGSTFYMATGFHGFHVVIGTTFLTVCLYRILKYQITRQHHFGVEAAAWYWHFVDVVWLFLFVSIYWWGGN